MANTIYKRLAEGIFEFSKITPSEVNVQKLINLPLERTILEIQKFLRPNFYMFTKTKFNTKKNNKKTIYSAFKEPGKMRACQGKIKDILNSYSY